MNKGCLSCFVTQLSPTAIQHLGDRWPPDTEYGIGAGQNPLLEFANPLTHQIL